MRLDLTQQISFFIDYKDIMTCLGDYIVNQLSPVLVRMVTSKSSLSAYSVKVLQAIKSNILDKDVQDEINHSRELRYRYVYLYIF